MHQPNCSDRHSKNKEVCRFAQANWRRRTDIFGIKLADRLFHFYILGKTGTGKTTMLYNKIRHDVLKKNGLCLIDIHGDLVQEVIKSIPKHRKKDLIYLDATDTQLELGYNPLKRVSYEKRALVASSILEVFQRLWGNQAWGVKMAHILRNILLTLLDQDKASFTDIIRLLNDPEFRNQCLIKIQSTDVRVFWQKEFDGYSKNDLLPIYNKIGAILSYPQVKRILVTNKKQISLSSAMDNKKILLVNISKGALGTEASYIIGSLLLTSIASASFNRINTKEENRIPFFLYLDEFQHYTNLSLVEMLSELRKFKVGLVMANQYLGQLDPRIKDALLGNVGTVVSFRLSLSDARILEKEFYPIFKAIDFVDLPNYHIYLRMMIDGKPSKAFSAVSLKPLKF
ncbi:MAG: ATP-binding protein [Bacteroidia bacterium]|nr:ATP-binding protein [Bacteroidia bacterium]